MSQRTSALFTDLHELTMARAYAAEHMDQSAAVFELTFRKMPRNRNYIVAAGIGDVLEFLSNFRFDDEDLEYLRHSHGFPEDFLKQLQGLRFTGDVFALPEGTPSSRTSTYKVSPSPKRFGWWRAPRAAVSWTSARAALMGPRPPSRVARATYLGGRAGTSNVLAGRVYGIPAFGTMAHSYIQAHDSEAEAFEAFAALYPETTLLVDTYGTIEGVRKVINLARGLGDKFRVRAVRLDSGGLGALASETRRMLDSAGLKHVEVFASSKPG